MIIGITDFEINNWQLNCNTLWIVRISTHIYLYKTSGCITWYSKKWYLRLFYVRSKHYQIITFYLYDLFRSRSTCYNLYYILNVIISFCMKHVSTWSLVQYFYIKKFRFFRSSTNCNFSLSPLEYNKNRNHTN